MKILFIKEEKNVRKIAYDLGKLKLIEVVEEGKNIKKYFGRTIKEANKKINFI